MRSRSLQGLVLLSAPLQASCGGEGLRVRTEQNSNYAGLRESPPVTSPATPKVVIIGVANSCDIAARMRKAGDEAKAYGSVATAMTMGMVLFACCMG